MIRNKVLKKQIFAFPVMVGSQAPLQGDSLPAETERQGQWEMQDRGWKWGHKTGGSGKKT